MFRRRLPIGVRVVSVVAFAVLVSTALGSCGESQASISPEKAAFIRRANAICRARSAEIRFYAKPITAEKSKLSGYIYRRSVATDAYGPAFAREIREIHALRAPEGDSDQIDKILHRTHLAVDNARFYAARPVNFFARSERLAKEYGLTDCGHP